MAARSPILGVKHTAPSFEVTRNACDCHAHGFGPDDRFPFLPKRLYTPGSASTKDLNALHRTLKYRPRANRARNDRGQCRWRNVGY